jgi:hypothetical protein
MAILFDQLVSALAGAVIDAQHQVQQFQIGELSRYFKGDTPISVKLAIPRTNPDTGQQESREVSVPLITLVNPSQLSIQEMEITMDVDLSDNPQPRDLKKKQVEPIEKLSQQPSEWNPTVYQPMLSAATTTGKKPGDVGLAHVTLYITADEKSEGLSRLLDQLNKCL